MSFLSKTAPKLHAKEYQISGTLSAQETGYRAAIRDIYCCLSVSHTSLDIMMSRAAYDSSLYKTLMVHTMSFLPKTTIKFHAKCHISGTLWAWKLECCAVRIDIHCCSSVPYPSLHNTRWGLYFSTSYTRPSLFVLCHFCWEQLSNFRQNIRYQVPSQCRKWDAVLQYWISIAAWTFHTLL